MPTLQRMIDQGTSGNLRTLQPPLSPMLWTSIATGKRPYKHGIYGFTEPTPTGDGVQPMTNVSRSSKAVWNILNQHDKRSLVVGWWPSHPAEPIRGTMVSDFFHKSPRKPGDPWPLRTNCVHPPEKLEEIAELRVHPSEMQAEDVLPFVPEAADIDQSVDGRLSSVMKVTAECSSIHAAATLYAVPELNADVVSLTFSPGTVSFNTESDKRDVNLGTTGGASLGSFGQYNDSAGKSIDTQVGIAGLRLVSSGEMINTSTFTAGSSTSFSNVASGIVYIGFVTDGGNIGWFSVDLGGIAGDVIYNVEGGQYGNGGESLTVGNSTPAVPGLAALPPSPSAPPASAADASERLRAEFE